MVSFGFMRKKALEERPLEESNLEERPLPEPEHPQEQESMDMLGDLPEFPSIESDADAAPPLPEVESSTLEKGSLEMPTFDFEAFRKPGFSPSSPEKEVAAEPAAPLVERPRERERRRQDSPALQEIMEAHAEPSRKRHEEILFRTPVSCFLNIRSFREIAKEMEIIICVANDTLAVKARLESIKQQEDEQIKWLYNSLEGLHKKIMTIDDALGRQER